MISNSQLEDLYVVPEHRKNGLGKRLFGYLGEVAKERGCKRVEWRVLKVSSRITGVPVPDPSPGLSSLALDIQRFSY